MFTSETVYVIKVATALAPVPTDAASPRRRPAIATAARSSASRDRQPAARRTGHDAGAAGTSRHRCRPSRPSSGAYDGGWQTRRPCHHMGGRLSASCTCKDSPSIPVRMSTAAVASQIVSADSSITEPASIRPASPPAHRLASSNSNRAHCVR